ncbi:MAG UNVERIFIED_CONTAM: hypothetical protein LVR29_07150 [Microcystis novacekii LVE1205-3]
MNLATNQAIPLRDPLTNEIAKNLQGETIYLEPLQDATGKILKSSSGLPILSPSLARYPDTQMGI